jgi:hypothetical protein
MFFRVKKSGQRAYLQIVENQRIGGTVRQSVVANLGRAEALISCPSGPRPRGASKATTYSGPGSRALPRGSCVGGSWPRMGTSRSAGGSCAKSKVGDCTDTRGERLKSIPTKLPFDLYSHLSDPQIVPASQNQRMS